jgi:ABC-type antimicrobial peptide transport system permease subunit
MKRTIWITVTVIAACVTSCQDRDVYGGGASYSSILVVGSPPKQFGIEQESYWTDQAGNLVIEYGDARKIPPGYKHHIYTLVLVGSLTFRLPLPAWAVGVLAVVVVSAIGGFLVARRARRRPQVHEASIKS